ncbi:MAG: hypothetical protein JJ979_09785 [Roseibium sp.]|nr:hypothetical protein [Roseibium sp.]
MHQGMSGGRPASKAALEARSYAFERDRIVTRKELSRIAREASKALKLRPSIRLVLQELAACWGEQAFEGRILVWPSNEFLVEKTGLAERSIRYAIRCLINEKIILPKDSANGKRFAIKNRSGDITDAFGFDLRPVYARQDEFAALVDAQEREKEVRKRAFDDLTIMRRATQEAIRALSESDTSVSVDDLVQAFNELVERTPRRGSKEPVDLLLEQWSALRELAENRYIESGSGGKNSRHIDTNNDSSDFCNKATEYGEGENREENALSLGLLAEATPIVRDADMKIRTWPDAFAAARLYRPAIGAHPSAWDEAVTALGLEHAAATVLYVAQLLDDDTTSGAGRIHNPGGYFRALVRMMGEGRFNLAAELARLKKRRE